VRLVYPWLCDLVPVTGSPEAIAHEISLRGFEVASIEPGKLPVIDFEITANRPDCLSHIGLAREASTIWGLPLTLPDLAMPAAGTPESLDVRLEAPDLCPRYCAQVFEITVGPSPQWLADRLTAAGVRPISNIVDVTNYVMLELGQPMHAFDLERLAGRALVIRRAHTGEHIRTLDGIDRALEPDMLVIADGAHANAVAGVMGGHDSEISSATRLIALESAYFHPPSIRRTSKRLGLKTEASIRFERRCPLRADRRRHAARCIDRSLPSAASAPAGTVARLAHRAAARPGSATRRRRTHPHGAWLRRRGRVRRCERKGLARHRAELPRRRGARSGPHRRGRPALRLRSAADLVPGADRGAGAAATADRA
jgi:hypothetical protein